MYVACWFAVMKVVAIAVATMPLYRWRELTFMADKAEIAVAICDWRLRDEMETTLQESRQLRTCRYFYAEDRKSVVKGKSVSVRVNIGGRRTIKKKKKDGTSVNKELRLNHTRHIPK